MEAEWEAKTADSLAAELATVAQLAPNCVPPPAASPLPGDVEGVQRVHVQHTRDTTMHGKNMCDSLGNI